MRPTQKAGGDRGVLYPGQLYRGVIKDYLGVENTYSIAVNGQVVEKAISVVGLFGALLGMRTRYRIPVGTEVLLFHETTSWIIATYTADKPDERSHQTKSMTGCGIDDAMSRLNPSQGAPPDSIPTDLFEGEFEMGQAHSTFIRFLLFMTSIGAGQRAQIEFHVSRQLVRLISENYEHFSSNGDLAVFNDGRLNTELHGTTYEHERWGKQKPTDSKMEEGRAVPEPDKLDTPRWRYTLLLGHIGGLFNFWVNDPAEAVGRMVDEISQYRSGKARTHIGQDGTILFQSCAEVAIERVHCIPVPIRLKHPEDAEGVLAEEMSQLDKTFLKEWDQRNGKTEHHTLFQIREYSRWLSQYHSLARIHQLAAKAGEWKVPSEKDTPEPSVGCGEDDREAANSGDLTYYKKVYSTIRLMRDGSTLIQDGYGNLTATGPWGIIHSSMNHYRMFCAGDASFFAGGSLFFGAKRHMEFISHRGSLVFKARTALKALCERGSIWLKSDCDPDDPYSPEDSNDPTAEIIAGKGVIIQSSNGSAALVGASVHIEANDDEGDVDIISTKGSISIGAKLDLKINASRDWLVSIVKNVKMRFRRWDNVASKGWGLSGCVDLKPGELRVSSILCGNLRAADSVAAGVSELATYTHDGSSLVPPNVDVPPLIPVRPLLPGASWSVVGPDEYQGKWNPLVDKSDAHRLYRPYTVSYLAEDNDYDDWSGDDILEGPNTSTTRPWPGSSVTWLGTDAGDALDKPSEKEPSAHSTNTALTSMDFSIRVLKRK